MPDVPLHTDVPSVPSDALQAVREQHSGLQRQELFSFAAAQMLDLGSAEALALFLSQDTAGRMEWVLTGAPKPSIFCDVLVMLLTRMM